MDFNRICKNIIWFCIMLLILVFTGLSLITCVSFVLVVVD